MMQAVVPSSEKDSDASTPYERKYPLTVLWKGEDPEHDSFILHCRQEYQLKVWESEINGLIGPSGQGFQLNDGSGATSSSGSGPPPEIRDLNVGSPTPAGNTLPSDCQPRVWTEPNDASPTSTVVKVKVHFNGAMFVLQVLQTIDYDGLGEKIMCKLRLLGPLLEEPV
ncbi:hypothetical protein DFH08DRAFT_1028908 [Mycena albidolilacea]|uniref:Uncharacterized protein n=1 Tax=Mycena albidolilacea TaxID=1033008 RepID=A0AAD6ZJL9_9AGAR|nr:hypothetical protein DFH08DRAFT_1028908 [Mycena albidolilacea]